MISIAIICRYYAIHEIRIIPSTHIHKNVREWGGKDVKKSVHTCFVCVGIVIKTSYLKIGDIM